MSEKSGQSEQEQLQIQTPALGNRWGDPISAERRAELQGYLDRWEAVTDHGARKGPFAEVELTGADVHWLAEQSGPDENSHVANLHLQYANLFRAHLVGANLREAHLDGARLTQAHLEHANLSEAHLEHANLRGARLEGAFLIGAHLEHADLSGAHLEHANLRAAWFDKASHLYGAILTGASLEQVSFDQTNLTVVDWGPVNILGDETTACTGTDVNEKPKDRATRLKEYKAAVRANRLLAVALRNQGMNEDADRFAYRAQLLQQQVLRRQHKYGAYFFSRLIDGLAGYGYKPVRSLIVYLFVVFVFAAAYYLLGPVSGHPFYPDGALIFSLTSFHGRGFFPGGLNLESWIARLAAIEAVTGLLIEISFIATFTQRFFGR
ncbi:MAG: pentapeptide repeat-containing protein [Ktedonobacterales bacterium]